MYEYKANYMMYVIQKVIKVKRKSDQNKCPKKDNPKIFIPLVNLAAYSGL